MEARDPRAHINQKEIEAVLRALERHQEELEGRHVVWYSDSTTALAAIRRQGTQKLSDGAWKLTKEVLDLAEERGIRILPKHVPGRLNGAADALSRPGEERSEWARALERVTEEWGPLEEDPCGATRGATCLLEGLGWASRRTLLFPRPQDVARVLEYLGLCAAKEAPDGDPSIWPQMAVVIAPLWRGARWWPALEKLRVAYLALGRLGEASVEAWRQRNGHWPEWTASLVPLKTPSGRGGHGGSMKASSGGSSGGRREGGWHQVLAEEVMKKRGGWRDMPKHSHEGCRVRQ